MLACACFCACGAVSGNVGVGGTSTVVLEALEEEEG